jgi:hypothetical protein
VGSNPLDQGLINTASVRLVDGWGNLTHSFCWHSTMVLRFLGKEESLGSIPSVSLALDDSLTGQVAVLAGG